MEGDVPGLTMEGDVPVLTMAEDPLSSGLLTAAQPSLACRQGGPLGTTLTDYLGLRVIPKFMSTGSGSKERWKLGR